MKNFTKILFAAVVFSVFFVTSCSKDKDSIDSKEEKKDLVIGKWDIDKIVIQEIPGDTETLTGKAGEWVEFKKDGTSVSRSMDEETGEFETEDPVSWKIDGNTLIIDNEEEYEIVKLTSKEMIIRDQGVYKLENGGEIKWTHTMYLKK